MSNHSIRRPHEIAIEPGQVVRFRYTNWQGVVADRKAKFEALIYTSNEWHRTPQWLIKAIDIDKGEVRMFALQDMAPLDE